MPSGYVPLSWLLPDCRQRQRILSPAWRLFRWSQMQKAGDRILQPSWKWGETDISVGCCAQYTDRHPLSCRPLSSDISRGGTTNCNILQIIEECHTIHYILQLSQWELRQICWKTTARRLLKTGCSACTELRRWNSIPPSRRRTPLTDKFDISHTTTAVGPLILSFHFVRSVMLWNTQNSPPTNNNGKQKPIRAYWRNEQFVAYRL